MEAAAVWKTKPVSAIAKIHGSGRGCLRGGDGRDFVAKEDPRGQSKQGINGRKKMITIIQLNDIYI